jgi:hypothetical protein
MREKEQMTDNEIEIDVYFFLHHMRETKKKKQQLEFYLSPMGLLVRKRRLWAPSNDFIKSVSFKIYTLVKIMLLHHFFLNIIFFFLIYVTKT